MGNSSSPEFDGDESVMRRALELAARGVGFVEPNPMVGAVIVDGERRLLGEGFHERFGDAHAEINALQAAGDAARGATLFVTLEPCSHHGKTGPCVEAVIRSGIRRVVVGAIDPNPRVAGRGVQQLLSAGIEVETGLLREDCERVIAPFAKWVTTGIPWVHTKWAMTLDGRIATRTGHSQWISNPASRREAHRLRGRMDAILIGSTTAALDNPLLTARPPGPRTANRVVVSGSGRLDANSRLAQSATESPVLITAINDWEVEFEDQLRSRGVEVVRLPTGSSSRPQSLDLQALLRFLGGRNATNVLVEGGGGLLGSFFESNLIDEVHVFVAPKLAGGDAAVSPLTGIGRAVIPGLPDLDQPRVAVLDTDVYIQGRIRRGDSSSRNGT